MLKIIKGRWTIPDGIFRPPNTAMYSGSIKSSLLVPMLKPEPTMRPSASKLLQTKLMQHFIRRAVAIDEGSPSSLTASLKKHLRIDSDTDSDRSDRLAPDGPQRSRRKQSTNLIASSSSSSSSHIADARRVDAINRISERRNRSKKEEQALGRARKLHSKVSNASARVGMQKRNDAFFAKCQQQDGIVMKAVEKEVDLESQNSDRIGVEAPCEAPASSSDAFCEIYVDGLGKLDVAQQEEHVDERVNMNQECMKSRAIEAVGHKLYVRIRRYLLSVINDTNDYAGDQSDVVQSTLLGLLGEENMHIGWMIYRTLV